MIRIRIASNRQELETLANQMETEGFELHTLTFRGIEAWAVFQSMPIVSINKPEVLKIVQGVFERQTKIDVAPPQPVRPPENRSAPQSFKRRGK